MRTTNKTHRCQDLSVPESSGKIDQGCHVKFCLVLNLLFFFKLPIDDGVFEMFNSIRQFVRAFECTTGITVDIKEWTLCKSGTKLKVQKVDHYECSAIANLFQISFLCSVIYFFLFKILILAAFLF